VSTQKQGESGLGLEAQQAAVESYLRERGGHVLTTFEEVESGRHNDRPTLALAGVEPLPADSRDAVVAKLDRLSRNAAFLMNLKDAGVRFVAADLPDANELTWGSWR
jgi:DNA invertase Pin-like site-specific DNA recombinase